MKKSLSQTSRRLRHCCWRPLLGALWRSLSRTPSFFSHSFIFGRGTNTDIFYFKREDQRKHKAPRKKSDIMSPGFLRLHMSPPAALDSLPRDILGLITTFCDLKTVQNAGVIRLFGSILESHSSFSDCSQDNLRVVSETVRCVLEGAPVLAASLALSGGL